MDGVVIESVYFQLGRVALGHEKMSFVAINIIAQRITVQQILSIVNNAEIEMRWGCLAIGRFVSSHVCLFHKMAFVALLKRLTISDNHVQFKPLLQEKR